MILHFDHFTIYSFICRFVDLNICRLYSQFLPSGHSSAFEHLAADPRRHAGAEPVLSCSLFLLRLIDSLWHGCSISDPAQCNKNRLKARICYGDIGGIAPD